MLKRIASNVIIVLFLYLTADAFLFSLLRMHLPFIPYDLACYHYGMMAPYQGYNTENWELVAEGIFPDGSREQIDLHRFIPFSRGQFNVRGGLIPFRDQTYSHPIGKYGEVADQLHLLLPQYAAVLLYFETWPMSPGGFEYLRIPFFVSRELLTSS